MSKISNLDHMTTTKIKIKIKSFLVKYVYAFTTES